MLWWRPVWVGWLCCRRCGGEGVGRVGRTGVGLLSVWGLPRVGFVLGLAFALAFDLALVLVESGFLANWL